MSLGFAIPMVIAFGLVLGTGTYTFNELVQYLKEKSPATQTLLDHIYVKHFQATTIRNWLLGVLYSILILGLQLPWYLTLALGWCDHFMKGIVGIHLFVCLMVKVFLIYKPEILEDIPDEMFSTWSW